MKNLLLIVLLLLTCTCYAQNEKLCVHEMEFPGDVFVNATLPCNWKKDKVQASEETRKFAYNTNGVNYNAVIVVSKLPINPDSATRTQMISEQALTEAGKSMGTVVSAGSSKMGLLPAGELIFKAVKGSGADKKYAYMLQYYAVLDDRLIVVNMGIITTDEKLAQTNFEKNKELFRKYAGKVSANIDYSRSLMR
ncbi:MAG: hypothetical protein EOO06_00560 [Chitinophagaceae bacterium]|nr:MAG: hypothetical protein EOO06_00560 [Chitinophagaceae bacterium]